MTPTKEQMELAAKAYGIERLHFDATGTAFQVKGNVIGSSWRPLTSGDDSQRLQVKLGMTASVGGTTVDACCWADKTKPMQIITKALLFDPAIPDDDLRAMREAIFLVAVEVGRAK